MSVILSPAMIENIIAILAEVIPLVTKEVTDVWPRISAVINSLMSSDEITQAQLDQLYELKQAADEAFEAAVAARAQE